MQKDPPAQTMSPPSFVHSSLYKLDSYIHDRRLLKFLHERLKTRQKEEMFVERFTGNHYQHFFYVRKKAKVCFGIIKCCI